MAKRRMRRMTAMNANESGPPRRSPAESLGDTARDLSLSTVKAATEATRAALQGMQEIGRTMAGMAVPAARRSVKMAGDMTRAALESTRQLTRTAADSAREAARSGADTARRATRSAASRTSRPASRTTRKATRTRRKRRAA